MILQDVTRETTEDVMSRPEFQYPRSLMERFGDWIADRLDDLFGNVDAPGAPNAAFSGAAGQLIGYLLIFLALAAIVAVVVIAVRRWRPRVRAEGDELSEAEVQHRRSARDWASEASRWEAEGEWKLAVRARYRELVRTLVDRRQVADLAGRTTGELRDDIAVSTPAASDAFDTACLLFELPWYADVPATRDTCDRLRVAAERVLAAPVVDSLAPTEIVSIGSVSTEPEAVG